MTPSEAMKFHKSTLMATTPSDKICETLANAQVNPTGRSIYHLYEQWRCVFLFKSIPSLIFFWVLSSSTSNPKTKESKTPPNFVNIQTLQEPKEEEESHIKIETDETDLEEAAMEPIPKEESDKEVNVHFTRSSAGTTPRHPLQIFFDSMAHTVMRFPPPLAVRAKIEVLQVISRLELEMWNQPKYCDVD